MSEFSPRRALLLSVLSLLLATAALAVTPTARYDGRMVYDPSTTHTVLFGGSTAFDSGGTRLSYEFNDTWDWNGVEWTQLFPLHIPTARYGFVMVFDTKRNRAVMFGGRTGNSKQDLNDTWVFKNGDWTQIDTPTSPGARVLAGGTYDPVRDRVVVFGGATISADSKTVTPYHDTWEFDGTNWTQVLGDGPKIDKPLVVYDTARQQIVMLGVDSSIATHMFTYDPAAPAWNEKTGLTLPPCVNEGALVNQQRNDTLFFTGGSCTGVSGIEDNYEWDGNAWNKIAVKQNVGRAYGQSIAYDASRQVVLLYGGNPAIGGLPRADLWAYNGDWSFLVDANLTPPARSLFVFRSDPTNGVIWLFGGLDPNTYYADLWKFQYGKWQHAVGVNAPPDPCHTPSGDFDVDRGKLVVICGDTTKVAEWNGTDWNVISSFNKAPQARLFSSAAYDQNLKKTVLFGGYVTDYINETWMWDGSAWTQQTHNLPPQRALAAMWYDPHLNRTVIFGGIGRQTSQDRITRFNDMWSFDGNGWTQIKPATTPPPRYGAQVTVDPRNGNVIVFGGIRVDTIETPGTGNNPPTTSQVQVYANDFWQWDGTDWKQLTFPRVPYARENGGMAFDPSTQLMVVFGGYAGQQYLSDLWTLTDANGWQPQIKNVFRRHAAGGQSVVGQFETAP